MKTGKCRVKSGQLRDRGAEARIGAAAPADELFLEVALGGGGIGRLRIDE